MIKKGNTNRRVLSDRERDFVLDCVNANDSKMPLYDPLKDKYMSSSITA